MRHITKQGSGGNQLAQEHAVPPITAGQATSRWSAFGHKGYVLGRLLAEQYQLCCYSEIRSDLDGHGYHIEHVKPKSAFPQETFNYQNLAASALSSDDLAVFKVQRQEVFGGHAKQNYYDPAKYISCHQPDCARFFAYLSDGRVVPAAQLNAVDEGKAKYTIDLLNLNSPYLINQRRRWWEELDDLFGEHQSKGWSVEDLAAIDLIPAAGKLSPFFSLTRLFFGRIAEQVLSQYAPQLV